MKVTNIDWDIDVQEAINTLQEMPKADATKLLGIKAAFKQNSNKFRGYCETRLNHEPQLLPIIEHLPTEIDLPESFDNEPDEVITEYLSNEYGYCINGYALDRDQKQAEEIER